MLKLRKETKNYFKKYFFKLINNAVFGKTMENVGNHRDIKLVTTDKKEIIYCQSLIIIQKMDFRVLLAADMKKIKVKINKPLYLGLSILEISKTLLYNFDMIILKQSISKIQNYVIWIQIALSFISKVKMFMKILQMLLKKDLIHQIMKLIDHCLQEKIKSCLD